MTKRASKKTKAEEIPTPTPAPAPAKEGEHWVVVGPERLYHVHKDHGDTEEKIERFWRSNYREPTLPVTIRRSTPAEDRQNQFI